MSQYKDAAPAPYTDAQRTGMVRAALEEIGDAVALMARAAAQPEGSKYGQSAALLDQAASRIRKAFAGEAEVGSKINPGAFDCYADALPDEPLFVLMGRDDSAPELVERWADHRETAVMLGNRPEEDRVKVAEARRLAVTMRQWREYRYGAWKRDGQDA